MAGPVLPIGKNSSGSSSRHAERWRQSMAADSFVVYKLVMRVTHRPRVKRFVRVRDVVNAFTRFHAAQDCLSECGGGPSSVTGVKRLMTLLSCCPDCRDFGARSTLGDRHLGHSRRL